MAWQPDRDLHWDLLAQHREEAAFLWQQWEHALDSPQYSFVEIARDVERRLRAHVRALAKGGRRVKERVLLPALTAKDPGTLSASAYTLLDAGEGQDVPKVIRAFALGKAHARGHIARALEVSETPEVVDQLLPVLDVSNVGLLTLVVQVLGSRRKLSDEAIHRLVGNADSTVRATTFAAARHSPTAISSSAIEAALRSSSEQEREAALLTGLVGGMKAAWKACQARVSAPGRVGRLFLVLFAMGSDEADTVRLLERLDDPDSRNDTLFALGYSGRVVAAEVCLPFLENEDETVSRLAAEAFSAITGLAISGQYARDESPEDEPEEPVSFEEEDLEADLVPALEAALPLAEPDVVRSWWAKARPRFDPSTRTIAGKPFDLGTLVEALRSGQARRRQMLGLELAIRSKGTVQVETRAFAATQLRQLDAAQSEKNGSSYTKPFSSWMAN
jgi:uncharacterized protein (TIGR02270 family)